MRKLQFTGRLLAQLSFPILASSLLCLTITAPMSAQQQRTGMVNVRVTDTENEQPIEQVEVKGANFAQGTYTHRGFTDGGGRITFPAVSRGAHYLEVSKDGYEPAREQIDVVAGVDGTYAIRLRRRADNRSAIGPAATVSATIPPNARNEFDQGMAKLKDDPGKSIDHFRKAIEEYPKYAMAYTMMGLAHMRRKESHNASLALSQAVELDPKLAIAHTLLGKLQIEERKFERAEQLLRKSAELDPQAWDAHYELSRCYFNLKRYDEALTCARSARQLPQSPPVVHLLLVDIYLKRNEREKALRELQAFAQADPNSPFMPRVRQMIEKLGKEARKEK